MQQPKTLNDIVFDVLTIIEYADDKEKFVKEFQQLNHEEAIYNVIEKLPEETKEKVKEIKDPQELGKYITQEKYIPEMIKVSIEALKSFIESIAPALTKEQKEKVTKLFLSIEEAPAKSEK